MSHSSRTVQRQRNEKWRAADYFQHLLLCWLVSQFNRLIIKYQKIVNFQVLKLTFSYWIPKNISSLLMHLLSKHRHLNQWISAQTCFHVWNNNWRQICFISQKTPKMASLLLPHWGSLLCCRQTHKQTHQLPSEYQEQDVAAPVRRAPQLTSLSTRSQPVTPTCLYLQRGHVEILWQNPLRGITPSDGPNWMKYSTSARLRYDCMTKTPLSSATCSVYVSAGWLMEVTDCCSWH